MNNLDLLCCPFCGDSLKPIKHVGASSGIVRCDCSQYPVIDDIPILIGESIDGTIYTKSRVIKELEKGDKEAALACMMTRKIDDTSLLSLLKRIPFCSRIYFKARAIAQRRHYRDILSFISADSNHVTFKDFLEFYFGKKGNSKRGVFNYYYYKYGEPRYFAAKALMPLYSPLLGQPVLDIGCGTGQLTRELGFALSGGSPIYALELNFFCAYVAKKFVYKKANYVICDVNNGLPFRDHIFGGVFCTNTLHVLRNKKMLFQELSRVTKKNAIMAFTSVRHNKGGYNNRFCPIGIDQYRKLISNKNCHVVSDDHLVDAYFNGWSQSDAGISSPIAELEKFGWLAFIVGEVMKLSKQEGDSLNVYGDGNLNLNPLYQCSAEFKNTLVRLTPSELFEKENYKMAEYFPRKLKVSDSFFDDLKHRQTSEEIVDLYRRGVLVNLPSGYC